MYAVFKTAMTSLFLSAVLLGCDTGNQQDPLSEVLTIQPTTGVFSEAEEVFYEERLENMQTAFRSGMATTIYDTKIEFGMSRTLQPLPRARPESLSQNILTQLYDYVSPMNSASLLVFESGSVVSEHYFGETSETTLINSKSLAKPLGVIAMGRAIEKGFVASLDQPVSDFIIEWKDTEKSNILIRHVLDMRTGLLAQDYTPETEDVLNRAYLHPRHDEIIIHEYPLINEAGTRYDYGNATSDIVAIVIERATGQSYQDWVDQQVLAPLGAGGGTVWLNRNGGMAHSGCCFGLPTETYLKLAVLVMQKGVWGNERLLSEDFMTQMISATPQNKYAGMGVYLGRHYKKNRGAGNPDEPSYAATLHSEPYIDEDIILFDGNGNQVAYIFPEREIIVMRLGSHPPKETPWDNSYIPNLVSKSLDTH